MLLAIDPGADAGWARFNSTTLQACGLAGTPAVAVCADDAKIERVIIEKPMIYPGGRQQARPADVIKLAVRAGEWGGRATALWAVVPEYVEPFRWKGSIPKDIHHARIWARLTPVEQAVVSEAARGMAPSKRHNVMDAVGLGLYAIGRKA